MKYYVDTSVLTAFYCREAGSEKAEKALRSGKPLLLSHLGRLEMASAVTKKVRTCNFDEPFARNILSIFHSHISDGYYHWIPIDESDFEQADMWISCFAAPLRSLDSLHLALAHRHDATLLTADQPLALAAKVFKVPCRLL